MIMRNRILKMFNGPWKNNEEINAYYFLCKYIIIYIYIYMYMYVFLELQFRVAHHDVNPTFYFVGTLS